MFWGQANCEHTEEKGAETKDIEFDDLYLSSLAWRSVVHGNDWQISI